MDNNEFDEVLRAHLEAVEPEYRWSFAIDMERIKGEIIAQHDLPDAMIGANTVRLCQVIMGDCCSWNGCVLRTSEKRKGYFDFKC